MDPRGRGVLDTPLSRGTTEGAHSRDPLARNDGFANCLKSESAKCAACEMSETAGQNPNRLSDAARGPRRVSTSRSPPLQAELP